MKGKKPDEKALEKQSQKECDCLEERENFKLIASTERKPPMSDMLPCPFCGGEATIIKDYSANCFGERKVVLRTECAACEAKPYWTTVYGTTDKPKQLREKVVDAEFSLKEKWNKRHK